MQFNQSIRIAFAVSALRGLYSRKTDRELGPYLTQVADSLKRTAPVAKTKEDKRGWRASLSFKTHRKLTQQGYEVL